MSTATPSLIDAKATGLPTLDPAHLQRLRDLRPDDPGAMLGVLSKLFSTESQRHMASLERSVGIEDWPGMRKAAHGLSGCAANIGAIRLAAMAKAVEAHRDNPDPGEARTMQSLLTGELQQVLARVAELTG